jgi:hypothetical protein
MSVSAFQERVLSTHHRGAVMDRKNDWDRGAVILPCPPRKGGNFGEEETLPEKKELKPVL